MVAKKNPSLPHFWRAVGGKTPHSSSWVSGKSLWMKLDEAFLLHLFAAGLLVLCFPSDSGSRGLHTIYTVSTTDLTTSGDREKFSTIPFPGKTEIAKRCLSGIEKCSYAKAKLCCNERTWWPSCKTYSHLDPQSRGPFDARTVS